MYDTIVIGAGIMGGAAASNLAKAGASTLVLEQFSRGHTFGSSHGDNRIIRLIYEKQFYTELMKHAYTEWREVEKESGKDLLFTTGSVIIGPEGHDYLHDMRVSLNAAGVESEWWDQRQLADCFPQFRIGDSVAVLWQKDTGFLSASMCVLAYLQLAEAHGAEVRENTSVIEINWQGTHPEVITTEGRFQGKKVILTTGAWTGQILSELNLPLTVTLAAGCLLSTN